MLVIADAEVPVAPGDDKLPHTTDPIVVISAKAGLSVNAGQDLQMAAERAYEAAEKIHFEGMQYRRDIGHRAFGRR